MRVAVGILAYNEEANIAASIEAVRAQTGPPLGTMEVWVVASGCTDRTVPRAEEAAAADPRVREFLRGVLQLVEGHMDAQPFVHSLVGRGDDEGRAGIQHPLALRQVTLRVQEVLDGFEGNQQVE